MTIRALYLIAVFCLFIGPATAGPPAPNPSPQDESIPVMAAPIRFFQSYLSGADGNRCPMTPSCSTYALQAMQRHGTIKGWIMACDRLMRCGHDELKLSPPTMTRSGLRCLDPLQDNDFWLH